MAAAKTKTVRKRLSNRGRIALENNGAGNPYPSIIKVKGLRGAKITKVVVTLNAFDQEFPAVTNIVLQAPNGKSVVLMRNCGGALPVSGVVLTLSDQAATNLPQGTLLQGGTFRPTDFDPDGDLPAPAPVTPNTKLSIFNRSDPSGSWKLFAANVSANEEGQIKDGWTLAITAKVQQKRRNKR